MKGKKVIAFIILVFSTIGCLSAQSTDTMYVVKRHVVRDTVYVRDTVRVQDTVIIADYIHSEEFKQLFYELSGADGQTPSDSLEKLWAQTVTFLENRVIQYEQQNVSTMDSIKKYGLAGLMLLGLNSLAPAQTETTKPVGEPHKIEAKSVLYDSPFNGFHFGYTLEADIVHPVIMTHTVTEEMIHSSVRYGGRLGFEFSYHFADLFGVSAALDYGYIEHDKKYAFREYYGLSMPLKFEFHYPISDKLWMTANAGVQLRMPWMTFSYGFKRNVGEPMFNSAFAGEDPTSYEGYYNRYVFYADLMADVGLYFQLPNQDCLRFLLGLNIATTDYGSGGIRKYSNGSYDQFNFSQRNHYLYFQIAYLHSFSKQRAIKQAQQHWTADKSLYRNEFRLGVSDPFGLWLLKNEQVDFLLIGDSLKNIIKENRHFTPVFSFDYHFRASKWFWLGLTTAYSYYKGTVDYVEGIVAAVDLPNVPVYSWQEKEHQFVIMPEVRFSYLNRPHVTLYSGLAVGVLFNRGNCYRGGTVPENLYHPDENHTSAFAAFQVTAFGLKAGAKHWFGSLELGAGIKGFANLGVGYEF